MLKKNKERGETVQSKKNLNILLEAVNILKTECLLKSEDTMKILKYDNKTIKPRPNGKGYYTRYRDVNGQHSIYGTTAEEVLQKLKTALRSSPKKKTGLTVMEWWNKFLEIYESEVSIGTKRTYTSIQNCYIKQIGNLYLKDLTIFNLDSFLKGINSSRQRTRVYNMLHRCLEKAKQNNLIEQNVLNLLPKPKHKKVMKEPLTEEEQTKLLKHLMDNPYHDLFLFMLQQGLRIGESLAIKRENINFEKRTVSILKTLSHSQIGNTKTNSSERIIPLFDSSFKLLEKYRCLKPNDRLFKISEATAFRNFRKIVDSAGLSEKITSHCLRKTFGTRIYENGVPLLTISKWLGHADTKITEQCYVRVTEKAQTKWLEKADFIKFSDTQIDTQIAN